MEDPLARSSSSTASQYRWCCSRSLRSNRLWNSEAGAASHELIRMIQIIRLPVHSGVTIQPSSALPDYYKLCCQPSSCTPDAGPSGQYVRVGWMIFGRANKFDWSSEKVLRWGRGPHDSIRTSETSRLLFTRNRLWLATPKSKITFVIRASIIN